MHFRKVGFIGLGIMGMSMSRNLVKSGFDVRVFNRSAGPAETLREEGIEVANSAADLADYAEVVLICVTDGAAERAVLFGEQGVLKAENLPSIVVDFSTISPADARQISSELAAHNIGYVDAPVSGGDVGARNATLTIMAGGKAESVDSVKGVFEAVGKQVHHMGPVGSGQLTKCVNQIVVANTVAAMTEGFVFAEAAGLDMQQMFDVIAGGAAGSWSWNNYGPRVLAGDLSPGFDAKHMLKDLDFALSVAAEKGVKLPSSERVRELYDQLCVKAEAEDKVLGNHGLISLYKV